MINLLGYQRLTPRIITFPLGVVGPLGSGSASRYPAIIDEFVPVPEPVAPATLIGHYHTSDDYRLLYGAIIGIQNVLGLNISGNAGTLAARLYGQGNIKESTTKIGFSRFARGWVTVQSNQMGTDPASVAIDLTANDFTGNETGYGKDLPVVFARVGRRDDGTAWHTAGPWRLSLVDNSDRKANKLRFAGRDIAGAAVGGGDTQDIFLQYVALNWKMAE